jgi:hypothetical protein
MYLRGMLREDAVWVHLTRDMNQWWSLVTIIVNIQFI